MSYKELKKKLIETSREFREEYFKRDLASELADLVVRARVKAGYTQADLAEVVGTKQSGISRVERGAIVPSLNQLDKIANALNLNLVIDFKESTTKTVDGWKVSNDSSVPSPYPSYFPLAGGQSSQTNSQGSTTKLYEK